MYTNCMNSAEFIVCLTSEKNNEHFFVVEIYLIQVYIAPYISRIDTWGILRSEFSSV